MYIIYYGIVVRAICTIFIHISLNHNNPVIFTQIWMTFNEFHALDL